MILAERLCLFGFDPHSGRERDAPERDALKSAIAGLMLADLLGAGCVVTDGDHLLQHDRLPLAHPLLREASERLAGPQARTPAETMHELRPLASGWWRRMHRTLAERDILEVEVPFPFLRRYRLRSRQAWQESAAPLQHAATSSQSLESIALTLAAQRCGWLADLVDANAARRCLVATRTAADEAGAAAWITRAFAVH